MVWVCNAFNSFVITENKLAVIVMVEQLSEEEIL